MAHEQRSKAGRFERRRAREREKQIRTGDSPDKTAEQRRKGGPTRGTDQRT
jgi:hypothetical protein